MHDEPSKPQLVDDTLEQHRACMQVVEEVEACLDAHPDREGQWVDGLLRKLPELARTMRAHFEAEEGGALFTKLPYSHPRLASRLRVLKDEHATMLEALDKVIARAERMRDAEVYELRELNAQVQLMIATIRRHEAAENEVVIEAHWDEVGVGD